MVCFLIASPYQEELGLEVDVPKAPQRGERAWLASEFGGRIDQQRQARVAVVLVDQPLLLVGASTPFLGYPIEMELGLRIFIGHHPLHTPEDGLFDLIEGDRVTDRHR